MKFYYKSLFNEHNNLTFEDAINQKKNNERLTLIFDTNICIYLSKIFQTPYKIRTEKKDIFDECYELLYKGDSTNALYCHGIGIDEASRNKTTFLIDESKQHSLKNEIEYILNMEPDKLMNFFNESPSRIYSSNIKQEPHKSPSDFSAENSIFKTAILTYACLLKLYLLFSEGDNEEIAFNKLKQFINFQINELKLIGSYEQAFAYNLFGKNDKLINLMKKKSNVLDNLWRTAIDLSIPRIYEMFFVANRTKRCEYPIFVTADVTLIEVLKTVKTSYTGNENAPIVQSIFLDVANRSQDFYKKTEDLFNQLRMERPNNLKEISLPILDDIKILTKKMEDDITNKNSFV